MFVCLLAMLGLIKHFISSDGRVLLQEETVMIGPSKRTPRVGREYQAGDDDD